MNNIKKIRDGLFILAKYNTEVVPSDPDKDFVTVKINDEIDPLDNSSLVFLGWMAIYNKKFYVFPQP